MPNENKWKSGDHVQALTSSHKDIRVIPSPPAAASLIHSSPPHSGPGAPAKTFQGRSSVSWLILHSEPLLDEKCHR